MTNDENLEIILNNNNFGDEMNKNILENILTEDIPFFIEYVEKLNSISTHNITEFSYSDSGDLFIKSETSLTLVKK